MSYTQLMIAGDDGEMVGGPEYRNSHGGSSMIWDALSRKYPKKVPFGEAPPVGLSAAPDLWERVAANPKMLHGWELRVLQFTYDNALIRGSDLYRFANDLELFGKAHSRPDFICHLDDWAQEFRRFVVVSGVLAIGLYATSCGDNAWAGYDGEKDEVVPYNILTDEGHWFVPVNPADDAGE